ncbi:ankyrin repeat domain-containing protein 17 [Purpureocillium lavendulum]|uniref:Ankyrin repeat domain-containing protein 17 n=1 Tax=Purpureocillium lavendulum TaxID=1247861 RepID=A0AB34FGD4_9HYPO|nr:ankyrin repeat domain-containing protein 17 [Purpureocillium lavendulum]
MRSSDESTPSPARQPPIGAYLIHDMDGLDYPDSAVMDTDSPGQVGPRTGTDGSRRSPVTKTRSLSDGGGTPSKLSPSPHIVEASRRTSKDDSALNLRDAQPQPPVTPRRDPRGRGHGLSLQMQTHMPRQFTPPPAASNPYVKPPPLSPKLDHSQIYASPTNILPRRSRGLDFSRAATSLHHSTLAEQSSPDSSPTTADRGVNIPSRRDLALGPEQMSTSLWSVMGNQEKMNVSSSLGSNHAHTHAHAHANAVAVASDSSSTSDDDLMDEDTDEAYVTTPLIKSTATMGQAPPGGAFGSPAMSSLMSFQQRQRPRKHPKKKVRAPLGLGFNLSAASLSKSPPSSSAQARRESISWQANQLHISSVEAEEGGRSSEDTGQEAQKGVVRRPVTRRGNLLPKTKTFARIRAALLEEGAPAEAETRREAEVVKQVRESDMDLEPRVPPQDATGSALSSPNMANIDADIPEEEAEATGTFKHHAIKHSKGKTFWDAFSESSSRTTPPPPPFLPRGSSSGVSEDAAMDSPSLAQGQGSQSGSNSGPSAAEITRRINNKRRRDDDLDPISFKRRAVSPGMSVHNSPVLQSPMQRDSTAWGSRPGSTGGDKGSSAPSDTGSNGGTPANPPGRPNGKGRVGFQGMVDTNDGIMRMSIE